MESGKNKETPRKKNPYKMTVKRAKLAGILCLAALLVTLIMMSPIFNIKSIEVEGNIELEKKEILDASGISKGDNIFGIDSERAKSGIKELGSVAGVEIERALPGRVTIIVDEKQECAYIMEKAAYTGIDENGMVISTMSALERKVPVIKGVKLVDTKKGQYMKLDRKDAKDVSALITRMLSELKECGILSKVKTIDITNLGDIKMTLTNGVLVNMGKDGEEDGDDIKYKIAFLGGIISDPDSQTEGVIDLSDTDNVTGSMS